MALLWILNLVTGLSVLVYGVESSSVAILHLKNELRYADICVTYNPFYVPLPRDLGLAYKIVSITPDEACEEHAPGVSSDSLAFIIKSGGNCTFYEKLRLASKSNAKQVIFVSQNGDAFPSGTEEQHENISFPVARVSAATWNSVVNTIGKPQYSQLYHPPEPPFDPNIAFLWLIAVFTVVTGGYWSGKKQDREVDDNDHEDTEQCDEYMEALPPITPIILVVFIVMLCVMLLLLYFFYTYLIYLVIAVFTIASVVGTYDCLSGFIYLYTCCECTVPKNNIPLLNTQPRVSSIVLGVFSLGLSIFWLVIRNEEYGWIFQDFLGVCLCITILRHYYLPNLKMSAILLLALLLYDIFFVFITPLFSAQGESVMIQVATGEGSGESIPMVIRLPKIIQSAMALCERPYSLLGLGDILVPGLFVSFCHNFDVTARTRYRVYFITSSIAYAFGLFLAFLVLVVMKSGQPALLYLSPSVLLSVTVVGSCRRDLYELWKGEIDLEKRGIETDSSDEGQSSKGNQKNEKDSLITNEEHVNLYNE